MTSEAAFIALVALILEALRWAILVGAFLFALYLLVRFVKWAWTDRPKADKPEAPLTDEGVGGLSDKLRDHETPLTEEEWGRVIDVVTFHTHDGRPICRKCGVPIPAGEGLLLADDEAKVFPEGLRGGFRHANEADCRSKPN